jgi:hypothetical protein
MTHSVSVPPLLRGIHMFKSIEQNNKIMKLWELVLLNDKRSFKEYFIEEHNIKLKDSITYKQLLSLCIKHHLLNN